MAHLDISPNGDTEIGFANIEGTDYVRLFVNDSEGDNSVSVTFTRAHFIAYADHIRMVADEIMAQRVDFPAR